ncbi:MAG: rhomboid family intramembrane serine protease [Anaerolineae bacterium]|nr:rhomboid family intramembrane serine protease [Anaerolineae bacterium]
MFPIGDDNVRGAGPGIVTVGLVLVNVAVFIAEVTIFRPGLRELFNEYGVVPAQVLNGQQLYSFVTSLFLHGGWLHLISNMLFLWIFGDNVEVALGNVIYPVFYLVGGIVASLAHVLLSPSSSLPSVGASGAIGAILGAYVVMFPRSQVRVLMLFGFFMVIRRVTAVFFLGIWFVTQFFTGIASVGAETAQSGGVAVWAHVGGFVFGLLIGFLFRGRAKDLTLERDRGRVGRGRL